MRVINAPLADDAPYKQFKFFFKSCTCVEFACISFDEVLSIDQRYNLNQIQRERIHAIYMAMKIYLKNRFLNKSTE